MDSVDAVADLFPRRAEAMRVGLDVEMRLEGITRHDLIRRLPLLLEDLSSGRAELPNLPQVRPHDLDQRGTVEVSLDAALFAADSDRVLLARPEHQKRAIPVAGCGLGGAARGGQCYQ